MKILVVEDDGVSRRLLEIVLRRLGHTVAVTSDGAEAWRALQESHFQIIISDLLLPKLDGIELCRRIRERNEADECYFMAVSLTDDRANRAGALRAGANGFLTKPLELSRLQAQVHLAERQIAARRI